jgi:hypothetical protein
MKNIHILPTDKPSRLHLESNGLKLSRLQYTLVTQKIIITSNEEIKEGDYYLVELFEITGESNGLHIEKCTKLDDVWCNNFDVISTRHKANCKKIILTTDQDLIKDGVQAIDNDFLEWFVKNPSCEEVKFKEIKDTDGKVVSYRFISALIPKEEPKQQSAVVFLVEELTRLGHNFNLYKKEIEQAKEMEKQQIIDSYASGYIDGVAQNKITAEQYYNKTFKK